MKKLGIIKKIDNLGRIQIPIELRRRLGLAGKVELIATDEGLLINNAEYTLVKIDSQLSAKPEE